MTNVGDGAGGQRGRERETVRGRSGRERGTNVTERWCEINSTELFTISERGGDATYGDNAAGGSVSRGSWSRGRGCRKVGGETQTLRASVARPGGHRPKDASLWPMRV